MKAATYSRNTFLFAAVLTMLLMGKGVAVPVVWDTGTGHNDHYYEAVLVLGGLTWHQANTQATGAGGYLATIATGSEDIFVYNLISNPAFWMVDPANNSQGPYLGGKQLFNQSAPNVGWHWVTVEPWVYTNWETGEPNDAPGVGTEDNQENYLQYFGNGNLGGNPIPQRSWNDIPGNWNGVKGYVVEWDSNPVPEPSTVTLFAFGALGLFGYGWRCRKR